MRLRERGIVPVTLRTRTEAEFKRFLFRHRLPRRDATTTAIIHVVVNLRTRANPNRIGRMYFAVHVTLPTGLKEFHITVGNVTMSYFGGNFNRCYGTGLAPAKKDTHGKPSKSQRIEQAEKSICVFSHINNCGKATVKLTREHAEALQRKTAILNRF